MAGQLRAHRCEWSEKRLRSNTDLREGVGLALKLGIAPRRFWGWEPKRTTTYVYDEDGRITGTVTETEPEWDDEQRELVTAWEQVDRETGQFGEDLLEATSPDADPANREGKYRYTAGVDGLPLINFAAKAAHDQMDRYYKDNPSAQDQRAYHVWPVQKVELGQ